MISLKRIEFVYKCLHFKHPFMFVHPWDEKVFLISMVIFDTMMLNNNGRNEKNRRVVENHKKNWKISLKNGKNQEY